ncbi:MAG: sel1 repeat family protein [Verrucomicrobiales bacterium]|nr:sel1 repeat family protein [Verrucomicrobiales bacterium]
MVPSMEQPWYQQLFSPTARANLETTKAKADRGDADAQFGLGFKYANCDGEARDYAQAAQWYLKAADQSHSLAQFNLAVMYAKGQGEPKDEAKALIWFRKAALQGDPGAQFNLGMREHRASSTGPIEDALESRIEAYKWYHLAAAQGYHGSASALEIVNLSMTENQVADGNRRAADFLAASAKRSEHHD